MEQAVAPARRDGGLARLVGLGLLSAALFSTTWIINRMMSLEGGHWLWSASVRYGYVLLLSLVVVALWRGPRQVGRLMVAFAQRPLYWLVAGSTGGGLFYAGVCFSADHAPGWVTAVVWQITILATPLVLRCFGLKVPLSGILFALMIVGGIGLVNLHLLEEGLGPEVILLGVLPVVVGAFAYPVGNQMLNLARNGDGRRPPLVMGGVLDDPFSGLVMLALGSVPFWLLLLLLLQPPPPTGGQLLGTFTIALVSGVLGTAIFLWARNRTRDAYAIAAVDATQAGEIVFTLAVEVPLLGAALPTLNGWLGMGLVLAGLLGFVVRRGDR